jgi:hypothetical protein
MIPSTTDTNRSTYLLMPKGLIEPSISSVVARSYLPSSSEEKPCRAGCFVHGFAVFWLMCTILLSLSLWYVSLSCYKYEELKNHMFRKAA